MLYDINSLEGKHLFNADLSLAGPSQSLGRPRIASAKRAFATRRVHFEGRLKLIANCAPVSGDIVLARVESLGHHQKLESPEGRRVQLYVGDEILVAYGRRYATDQFEADIPLDLGPCDLAASGGIAACVTSRHARARKATQIVPIGLVADAHGVLNTARFSLGYCPLPPQRPRVIAVVGTAMNSGKTSTAASLIHGLSLAGLEVVAAKATGTGSGNDVWSMLDAGASTVMDFTDLGHSTTAGVANDEAVKICQSLVAHAMQHGPDVIVIEIADGLLQRETAALLKSPEIIDLFDGVIFATNDAIGAVGGCRLLADYGHHVIAISGLVSAAPLAARETADALGIPVLGLDDLRDPLTAPALTFASAETRIPA